MFGHCALETQFRRVLFSYGSIDTGRFCSVGLSNDAIDRISLSGADYILDLWDWLKHTRLGAVVFLSPLNFSLKFAMGLSFPAPLHNCSGL